MSLSNDVNALVRVKKIKAPLAQLPPQKAIESVRGGDYQVEAQRAHGLVGPLTLEILTYDDAQDVTIDATNGTFIIKTAQTAQVIDQTGRILAIDTIIYPPAP